VFELHNFLKDKSISSIVEGERAETYKVLLALFLLFLRAALHHISFSFVVSDSSRTFISAVHGLLYVFSFLLLSVFFESHLVSSEKALDAQLQYRVHNHRNSQFFFLFLIIFLVLIIFFLFLFFFFILFFLLFFLLFFW
jgi:hypothetical protein